MKRLHHQGVVNGKLGTTLAVIDAITANVVLSSPIRVAMMMEVLRSSDTSVLTRATRRKTPRRRHSSYVCPRSSLPVSLCVHLRAGSGDPDQDLNNQLSVSQVNSQGLFPSSSAPTMR
jgi:hypothetical protein